MADSSDGPFDSIEGAREYVRLLAETIDEAQIQIADDLERALNAGERAARRVDALRLVTYKLQQLGMHIGASRRLLNDLRTLRRLLLAERAGSSTDTAEPNE